MTLIPMVWPLGTRGAGELGCGLTPCAWRTIRGHSSVPNAHVRPHLSAHVRPRVRPSRDTFSVHQQRDTSHKSHRRAQVAYAAGIGMMQRARVKCCRADSGRLDTDQPSQAFMGPSRKHGADRTANLQLPDVTVIA